MNGTILIALNGDITTPRQDFGVVLHMIIKDLAISTTRKRPSRKKSTRLLLTRQMRRIRQNAAKLRKCKKEGREVDTKRAKISSKTSFMGSFWMNNLQRRNQKSRGGVHNPQYIHAIKQAWMPMRINITKQ
jgi:hypothetical protein